eukprot:15440321-Alexandrium_andersonii.AAC.3
MSALMRQSKGALPQKGAAHRAPKDALVRTPGWDGRRPRSRQPKKGRSSLPSCRGTTSRADTRPLGGTRGTN